MKKYLSLALCVFVLTATANTAQAFDKKDLAKLKKTNQCIKCNLIGANLSGDNLGGADLTDANLVQARLSGANLSGTNLYKANLIGANLGGANLTKADLYKANLTGANLTKADLSGATWTDGIKCGKGSIGECVRDKRSTADKKAKPHDIPVKSEYFKGERPKPANASATPGRTQASTPGTTQAASRGGVKWAASTGGLPADAFVGGSEGSRKLAVCRAAYKGGTHPGKVVAGKCNIGWGGKEIVLSRFEVMTNKGVTLAWVKGPSAEGMIIGGSDAGRSLPVCRAAYQGGTHPGKVVAGKCNIGWGGKEIVLSAFEVLVQR